MEKEVIKTDQAPAAIGPYSQAIKAGDFVFVSGQIAIDPANGEVIAGDVQQQTDQVLKNVGAVLQAAGLSFQNIVKTTVFIRTMDDFPLVNEIYQKYFTEAPPARACVAVAGLPKGVAVEIEAVALAS